MAKSKITKTKEIEVIKNKVPKLQIIEKDEVILNGKKLERGKDYTVDIMSGAVKLNTELLEKMKGQKSVTYSSFIYREIKGKNVEKQNKK